MYIQRFAVEMPDINLVLTKSSKIMDYDELPQQQAPTVVI